MSAAKDKLLDQMDSFARNLLAEVNVPNTDIRDKVTVFKELTRFLALKHKVELPGDEEGAGINDYRRIIGGSGQGAGDSGPAGEGATAAGRRKRKQRAKLPTGPDANDLDGSALAERLHPLSGISGNSQSFGDQSVAPALSDGRLHHRYGSNGQAVVDGTGDSGDLLPPDPDPAGVA